MEQLDWSLVGKTQVVAVDMLWEHIPTVGLMVVENKRCGVETVKTDMVKLDVEIETVGEGVDEIDKWLKVAFMHQTKLQLHVVHVVAEEHEVDQIGSVAKSLTPLRVCMSPPERSDLSSSDVIVDINDYNDQTVYLCNTKDMFLVYGGDIKRELRVAFYTNAGYLTDVDDTNILATTCEEAEYIVALDTSKEDVWIRKFIYGFSVLPINEVPMKMYSDNTEAITIANEPVITKGARHYRAKVHYLREFIEFDDI
ncbi:hypothetical protein Tco_0559540 [Tanacetum coccineum]